MWRVTSTTRINYETTSLFPRVTFCNVNPYTTKRSYQLANETTSHEVFNFNITQRDTFSHSLDDTSFRECSFNTETCDSTDFFTRVYAKLWCVLHVQCWPQLVGSQSGIEGVIARWCFLWSSIYNVHKCLWKVKN